MSIVEKSKVFLKNIPLFAHFEPGEINKVSEIIGVNSYPKHRILFMESDPGQTFYIVKSGSVKVYKMSEDGREKIFSVFTKGDFFGEMALLDAGTRSATAETLDVCTLLTISRKDLLRLLGEHPELAFKMIQTLSLRLRRANMQLEDFAFRDARARVIRVILDLAGEHGVSEPDGLRLNLKLTHQELASFAGTSRETVTRVLLELQNKGLLRGERRQLLVKQPEALQKMLFG